jgi:hypothetical protein
MNSMPRNSAQRAETINGSGRWGPRSAPGAKNAARIEQGTCFAQRILNAKSQEKATWGASGLTIAYDPIRRAMDRLETVNDALLSEKRAA